MKLPARDPLSRIASVFATRRSISLVGVWTLATRAALAVLAGSGRPCSGIILAGGTVVPVSADASLPPVVVITTAVVTVIPFVLRYNRTGKSLFVTVLIMAAIYCIDIDSRLGFL